MNGFSTKGASSLPIQMTPVTLRSFSTPFSPMQVAGQTSYMPDSQLSVALLLILGMTPDESENVAR